MPFADDERLGGQGPEGGAIQALEELPAAGAVQAHRARVQDLEQFGDACVERGEGEEPLVAQPRQDPPGDDEHPRLDLGFISGFSGSGREDDRAGEPRELLVRLLQPRLVAARDGDAAFQLIGHQGGGDAPKILEGPLMAGDPVGDLLRAGGFGVGVVRGAEDGDEQLDRDHLARRGVDDGRLRAGVVDEALLAPSMDLAHREPAPCAPAAVELAELGIAIAVGVLLEVLEVQQLQGDAGLAPLGVQVGAIGDDAVVGGRRRGPIHAGLEDLVGQALDLGPIEPGGPGPQHRGADGAAADPQALGHRPVALPEAPLLSQNLSDLAHG